MKYKMKLIRIAIEDFHKREIWQCEDCERWHGFDHGAMDDHPNLCDECWAKVNKRYEMFEKYSVGATKKVTDAR